MKNRFLIAVGLLGLMALGTAACGGQSDPLSGKSGGQIATSAVADLKSAPAVRYTGTVNADGHRYQLTITSVRGRGCAGTMTQSQGTYQVVSIGNAVWVKPDPKFLDTMGIGADPALARKLSGKWLSDSSSGGDLSDLAQMCTIGSLINSTDGVDRIVRAPGTSTLAGVRVVRLRDSGDGGELYVTDAAHPRPVRLAGGGDGALNFIYPAAGTTSIVAPPAQDVVSFQSLGLT